MTTTIDGYNYTDLDLKIIAGVHKAVEDRGRDWVYPKFTENEQGVEDFNPEWTNAGSCLYVKDDLTPACLVGYAMVEAGVPARDLQVIASSDEVIDAQDLDVSWRVRNALERVQGIQDRQGTWGDALDAFGRTLATGEDHS